MAMDIHTITDAARNGDIDGWDPMQFDYQSPSFNSYNEGVGAVMENCKKTITKFNLHVANIPAALTKDGLTRLFSMAGKVKKAYLKKANTGESSTFGFVEFDTMKEALTAIEKFDKVDIGLGSLLNVQFSETPEQRELRLNREKTDVFYNPSTEGVDTSNSNPLVPKYNQSHNKPPSLPSAAGASNKSPSQKGSVANGSSPGSQPCSVCSRPAGKKCSMCQVSYCGYECQKNDWPKHQSECSIISQGRKTVAQPQKQQSPPESDNESFDFNCNPTEDKELQSLISSIKLVDNKSLEAPLAPVSSPPDPVSSAPRAVPPSATSSAISELLSARSTETKTKEIEGISINEIFAQFESITQPLRSVPLGEPKFNGKCPAIITTYRDVCHFSCIFATEETKAALIAIKSFSEASSFIHHDSNSISNNTVCGYIDKPGAFYRLKIRHNGSARCLGSLYDTGFRTSYQFAPSELIKLPTHLADIPSLFNMCSLNNVRNVPDAPAGGVEFLKGLLKGQPVLMEVVQVITSTSFPIVCCNIFHMDGSSIVDKIQADGRFAQKPRYGSSNPKQSEATSSAQQSRPALKQAVSEPIQASQLSPATTSPDKTSFPITGQNAGAAKIPLPTPTGTAKTTQMASRVPFLRIPDNTSLIIVPRVVISPSVIWAPVIHKDFAEYCKMQREINATYQLIVGSFYVPCVGELCAAMLPTDRLYYRAKVLCVNNSGTVDVQFVDIGNREIVTTEHLHCLSPQFASLPKQAIKFSLASVVPSNSSQSWSDAATLFVRDKILNRRVQVRVSTGNAVEMYDPEDPFNQATLNDLLVERKLASFTTEATAISNSVQAPTMTGVNVSAQSLPPALESLPPPLQSPVKEKPQPRGILTPPLSADTSPTDSPLSNPGTIIERLNSSGNSKPSTPSDRSTASKMIELKEGIDLTVTVSHVDDKLCFYIQQLSKPGVDQLKEVHGIVSQLTDADLKPLSSLSVNDICIARWNVDNEFYRAQVVSTEGSTAQVKYIDYGNIEKVDVKDLYGITESLKHKPSQAVLCTLNGVKNPAGKDGQWSQDAIQFLKQLIIEQKLQMKVIKCLGRKHVVELFVEENGAPKNVRDILQEHGHTQKPGAHREMTNSSSGKKPFGGMNPSPQKPSSGIFKQNTPKANSEQHPWDVMEDKQTSPTKSFGRPKENSFEEPVKPLSSPKSPIAAIIGSPRPKPPLASPAKPSPSYPLVKDVPVTNLGDSALIMEVESPDCIFIQPASQENANNVEAVTVGLSDHFQSNPSSGLPQAPPVGSLCAAKFSEDGQWYRAEVTKLSQDKIQVTFIDFGNTDTVSLQCLAPCPQSFAALPVCAVKCSLDGLSPVSGNWSPSASQQISSLCNQGLVQVTVIDGSKPTKVVKLNSNQVDVATALVEKGLAIIAPKLPKVADLPKAQLPSDIFQIVISTVVSPDEMYIQVASTENAQMLDKFSTDLEQKLSSKPPQLLDAPPPTGSLCCAKSVDDQCWYRAELLSINSTQCEVLYIDYGNKEFIPVGNLALCPEDFSTQSAFAICSQLFGVKPQQGTWSNVSCEFMKSVLGVVMKCKVAESGPVPVVRIKSEGVGDLTKEMIAKGLAVSATESPKAPTGRRSLSMLLK